MDAAANTEASIFQPGVVVIDENNGLHEHLVEQTKAFYRPAGEAVLRGEELATLLLRRVVLLHPWIGVGSLSWAPASVRA